MKICLVNMNSAHGDKDKNLQIMEQHIENALKIASDVDTIVFPELAATGYLLEKNLASIAENIDGRCVKKSQELARKYRVNLIAGFIEDSNTDKPYNSAFVINKIGKLITTQHKNHMFTSIREEDFYAPARELRIFELDGWICGLAICMDIRFPRLFESLAHSGAELIFVPANWVKGENKFAMLKFLTQTRAVENQIFCATVDRTGRDPNTEYTGSWMLADPLGNDIAETVENIYHIGIVEKEKISSVRQLIPLRPVWKEQYKIRKI